jgi:hypothetical protein
MAANRTALLINCSQQQAKTVRDEATREHRTVSGYVLHIVLRSIDFEDSLFSRHRSLTSLPPPHPERLERPRTTVLIRCSAEEARRIRAAAKRRDTTMSGYILSTLRRAWDVRERNPLPVGLVPKP